MERISAQKIKLYLHVLLFRNASCRSGWNLSCCAMCNSVM